MLLLNENVLPAAPMEEEEEEIVHEEDVAQFYEYDLETLGATSSATLDPKGKGKKRTRSSQRLQAISHAVEKVKFKSFILPAASIKETLPHHFTIKRL